MSMCSCVIQHITDLRTIFEFCKIFLYICCYIICYANIIFVVVPNWFLFSAAMAPASMSLPYCSVSVKWWSDCRRLRRIRLVAGSSRVWLAHQFLCGICLCSPQTMVTRTNVSRLLAWGWLLERYGSAPVSYWQTQTPWWKLSCVHHHRRL